jgi:hypothetical protein
MFLTTKKTYKKAKFIIKPLHKCHNIFDVSVNSTIDLSDQWIDKFPLSFNICLDLRKTKQNYY